MSDPIDIIGGVNSLDDVLSGIGYVLQRTTLDDLRACSDPRAEVILGKLLDALKVLLQDVQTLLVTPDDATARNRYPLAALLVHDLAEGASEFLEELRG